MKKFAVGDKVQQKNGTMQGEIVRVVGSKAIVLDQDGFELEYFLSQLLPIANAQDYENTLHQANVLAKNESKETKISKKHQKRQVLEIDLHIHQLTTSTRYMTNGEMLQLQLQKVKETLRSINKKEYHKVVFIHGKGTGKLRFELEKMLRNKKIEYYDASLKRYGGGALAIDIF